MWGLLCGGHAGDTLCGGVILHPVRKISFLTKQHRRSCCSFWVLSLFFFPFSRETYARKELRVAGRNCESPEGTSRWRGFSGKKFWGRDSCSMGGRLGVFDFRKTVFLIFYPQFGKSVDLLRCRDSQFCKGVAVCGLLCGSHAGGTLFGHDQKISSGAHLPLTSMLVLGGGGLLTTTTSCGSGTRGVVPATPVPIPGLPHLLRIHPGAAPTFSLHVLQLHVLQLPATACASSLRHPRTSSSVPLCLFFQYTFTRFTITRFTIHTTTPPVKLGCKVRTSPSTLPHHPPLNGCTPPAKSPARLVPVHNLHRINALLELALDSMGIVSHWLLSAPAGDFVSQPLLGVLRPSHAPAHTAPIICLLSFVVWDARS